MPMVEGFHRLFEANGDEQAHDNGRDMDEEVAPGVGGVFRRMYIEHRAASVR
jgi:hypothetical protein